MEMRRMWASDSHRGAAIYRPRLGTRKGHHAVVEFSLRMGKKSNKARVHLMDKMPTSQTAWRDEVCVVTDGWQFKNAKGLEVFRRFGKWRGLSGATLERMGKANKKFDVRDRLGKMITGFEQAPYTHVTKEA